ncbi:nuclear transport factor 2 family protein [Streptomyces sp. NPDC059740]|uniref:nuclear transport factor 2 family protein n=1 Tax=Streptomyces sp. NPDC059740 TaxID=3346926 RepID=UPI00364F8AF4
MTEQKHTPTAREVVERFLDAALDPAGKHLADLYGDPVVIEMPFAPPGFPRRTETTSEQLRARYEAGAGAREYTKVDSVVIHETRNPEVVVVEYDVHGKDVATGKQFVLSYINVMTVRDGRIVHSKDHSDPIVAAKALGMLPKLVEALTADLENEGA